MLPTPLQPSYITKLQKYAMQLLAEQQIGQRDALVYMAIALFSDANGRAFPGINTIKQSIGGGHHANICDSIRKLEVVGLISCTRRPGQSNLYQLMPLPGKQPTLTTTSSRRRAPVAPAETRTRLPHTPTTVAFSPVSPLIKDRHSSWATTSCPRHLTSNTEIYKNEWMNARTRETPKRSPTENPNADLAEEVVRVLGELPILWTRVRKCDEVKIKMALAVAEVCGLTGQERIGYFVHACLSDDEIDPEKAKAAAAWRLKKAARNEKENHRGNSATSSSSATKGTAVPKWLQRKHSYDDLIIRSNDNPPAPKQKPDFDDLFIHPETSADETGSGGGKAERKAHYNAVLEY